MDFRHLDLVAEGRAVAASGEARRVWQATGHSQDLWAGFCGVDQSVLSRWLSGSSLPRGDHAAALAQLVRRYRKLVSVG